MARPRKDQDERTSRDESPRDEIRSSREAETREEEKRPEQWQPPQTLPTPNQREGWVHRWVAVTVGGQPDNRNVSMRFNEGWEPVMAKEYPEIMLVKDHRNDWHKNGHIEVGGLVLCRAPKEKMEARRKYYENLAEQQLAAVDNDLMRESDARMPLLAPERRSNTTFGGR